MRRRSARATALRALFAIDLGKNDVNAALRAALAEERPDPEALDFARELLTGVLEHRDEIDQSIGRLSRDWSVARLAAVDRNLLRLGIFELSYGQGETPAAVVINEAVELAKEYSTPESGRFVNGILGNYARQAGLTAGGAGATGDEALAATAEPDSGEPDAAEPVTTEPAASEPDARQPEGGPRP